MTKIQKGKWLCFTENLHTHTHTQMVAHRKREEFLGNPELQSDSLFRLDSGDWEKWLNSIRSLRLGKRGIERALENGKAFWVRQVAYHVPFENKALKIWLRGHYHKLCKGRIERRKQKTKSESLENIIRESKIADVKLKR